MSTDASGLGSPLETNLPLFVYGNLKPGELGHLLISPWVSDSRPATVTGHLWVRDGVPLADLGSRGHIRGHLLTLSAPGYRAVGELEPTAYYQWAKVTCIEPSRLKANTLVAAGWLTPDRGGGDVLYEPWTSTQDPLLTYGLAAVTDTLRNDGRAAFQGGQALYEPVHWLRFYRLQAAYMLACSILERIAFRLAPNAGPTTKVNILGRQPQFMPAVQSAGVPIPRRAVYRADNPRERVNLNKADQFANWAYQIRSNLVHRGKSASLEAELVRTALIDLHDVLRIYLQAAIPSISDTWMHADPTDSIRDWRIKTEFNAPPDN